MTRITIYVPKSFTVKSKSALSRTFQTPAERAGQGNRGKISELKYRTIKIAKFKQQKENRLEIKRKRTEPVEL